MIDLVAGVALILIGVTFLVMTRGGLIAPWALVAMGVFEIFLSGRLRKFFWLRRQLKSKLNDAQITLTFDDEGFESSGPFSTGRAKWSGIEKFVRTPRGILLWPQKGVVIFLPEAVFGQEAMDFIECGVSQIP